MTATTGVGFSEAAEMLDRFRSTESRRQSVTVTFSNHPLDNQLIDVFQLCSRPEWEGEGSVAVDPNTLQVVKQLIESLPKALRTPTISGEPDGHVNLEWYVNPRCILSVSVSPKRVLHWAALIGEEDPRGSCRFYEEPPQTLLYWIERVCRG